ncbi:hypothetical protein [Phytoactinopolyspora halotolerans]|uniref:Uncharacterized protein n=1 Tax=Phytoactinopolyspora halotolerans TaxID=1981512 RepID=A0A6L9S2E0_9ACTN|nr:hypothetical protein [Phytoactinopolyspora halotolerans]NED98711.1 hypothetical protein [Phytoactinopolyspora halotolerans]
MQVEERRFGDHVAYADHVHGVGLFVEAPESFIKWWEDAIDWQQEAGWQIVERPQQDGFKIAGRTKDGKVAFLMTRNDMKRSDIDKDALKTLARSIGVRLTL